MRAPTVVFTAAATPAVLLIISSEKKKNYNRRKRARQTSLTTANSINIYMALNKFVIKINYITNLMVLILCHEC